MQLMVRSYKKYPVTQLIVLICLNPVDLKVTFSQDQVVFNFDEAKTYKKIFKIKCLFYSRYRHVCGSFKLQVKERLSVYIRKDEWSTAMMLCFVQ